MQSLSDDLADLGHDVIFTNGFKIPYRCRAEALRRAIRNLIENAVRYTPPESPIEVSTQCSGDEVVVRIADRGPGIPEHDRERVFDKFYRVLTTTDHSSASHPAGSGLGLAVCKGLIEAHAGRIWVEQRPEAGAIFFVALPVGTLEGSIA